jgi:hypothetical protein
MTPTQLTFFIDTQNLRFRRRDCLTNFQGLNSSSESSSALISDPNNSSRIDRVHLIRLPLDSAMPT